MFLIIFSSCQYSGRYLDPTRGHSIPHIRRKVNVFFNTNKIFDDFFSKISEFFNFLPQLEAKRIVFLPFCRLN